VTSHVMMFIDDNVLNDWPHKWWSWWWLIFFCLFCFEFFLISSLIFVFFPCSWIQILKRKLHDIRINQTHHKMSQWLIYCLTLKKKWAPECLKKIKRSGAFYAYLYMRP
jgi:hypothetical protein